jgi:hypothetical protein
MTTQDGLHIVGVDDPGAPSVDFTTARVLFDESAPVGCTFTTAEVSCPNVPRTVSAISFSYGAPGGAAVLTLQATVDDDACAAAYPPCED